MKIRHKLTIGYLASTLLVAAIGYLAVVMTRTAKEGFSMAANETIPTIKALEVLKFGGLRIVSSTNEFGFIRAEKEVIGQKTSESEKEEERLIELGIKLYNDALREYEDLLNRSPSKGYEVLEDIRKKVLRLQERSEELINLKDQGVSGAKVLEKKEVFERDEKAFLEAVDAAISHEGIEFLRRKARLESALEVDRNIGIAATLISVIAAIVIGSFVSRSIATPITRLRDAAGEIGKGNLDARADIRSTDEIGELAGSFNRMGEDLRRYHKHLEELVEARTAELKTANEQLEQEIAEHKQAEEALHRTEAELHRLSSQLLEVQENERKRISRELHDSIGQVLASVKIGLENAVSNIRQGMSSSSVESLEALIPVVQQGCEEVRRLHADLRPPVLDDLGIITTIFWFCREFEKVYSGIRIEKQINIEENQVPEPLKTVIFRVLQEALNNVSKHAKADLVRVSLKGTAGKIELVIEDNGQGFHVEQARSVDLSNSGFGLTSMKERTEVTGGSFSIKSVEGAGTTIRAWWPMKQ